MYKAGIFFTVQWEIIWCKHNEVHSGSDVLAIHSL